MLFWNCSHGTITKGQKKLRPSKRVHLTFSHRVQRDPLHELLFSLLPPILSCPRIVRV